MKNVFIIALLLFIDTVAFPKKQDTEFSQSNAHTILKQLSVDIGPRPMGSPNEQAALRYAIQKFKEYGCDTTFILPFKQYSDGNTTSGTAVGIKYGKSERTIVLGAHIDSAEPEIQGANDDGSGCAVVLEAARMFGNKCPNSTLLFCCFGGEEQGLLGSSAFVQDYPHLDRIDLMLQVDMADGSGTLDLDPDAHNSLSAPRWLVAAAAEEFSNLGYGSIQYPTHFFSLDYAMSDGPGSDHEPFLQHGIPAIAFVSDVGYPIHTPRDNFQNFNPSGLKRSGDLAVRLVERFDHGIPDRQFDSSLLFMVHGFPVFIPPWVLWIFIFITLTTTFAAALLLVKKYRFATAGNKFRWSLLQLFLSGLIIIACGWFASDINSMIKGMRHPWLPIPDLYFLLAVSAMLIGGWIALRINLKFKIADKPHVYFIWTILILISIIILFSLLSLKLTVEPTMGLFLLSSAILVRNPIAKLFLLFLAPLWMVQLIFSEWSIVIIHFIGETIPTAPGKWLTMNFIIVFSLTAYLFPFFCGMVAIVKDSPILKNFIPKLRRRRTFLIAVGIFISLDVYLLTIPTFDRYWGRSVHIDEAYGPKDTAITVNIHSPEYLNNILFRYSGGDTLVGNRTTSVKPPSVASTDSSWVGVERAIKKEVVNDTIHYSVDLSIRTKQRPYTCTITYQPSGTAFQSFESPLYSTVKNGVRKINWYSYPDSVLSIPIRFSITGNDTVKETITVVFDTLIVPIQATGIDIDIIPRTTFTAHGRYPQ
jgi:hypothetical protein